MQYFMPNLIRNTRRSHPWLTPKSRVDLRSRHTLSEFAGDLCAAGDALHHRPIVVSLRVGFTKRLAKARSRT
jgi:hypothetical protein